MSHVAHDRFFYSLAISFVIIQIFLLSAAQAQTAPNQQGNGQSLAAAAAPGDSNICPNAENMVNLMQTMLACASDPNIYSPECQMIQDAERQYYRMWAPALGILYGTAKAGDILLQKWGEHRNAVKKLNVTRATQTSIPSALLSNADDTKSAFQKFKGRAKWFIPGGSAAYLLYAVLIDPNKIDERGPGRIYKNEGHYGHAKDYSIDSRVAGFLRLPPAVQVQKLRSAELNLEDPLCAYFENVVLKYWNDTFGQRTRYAPYDLQCPEGEGPVTFLVDPKPQKEQPASAKDQQPLKIEAQYFSGNLRIKIDPRYEKLEVAQLFKGKENFEFFFQGNELHLVDIPGQTMGHVSQTLESVQSEGFDAPSRETFMKALSRYQSTQPFIADALSCCANKPECGNLVSKEARPDAGGDGIQEPKAAPAASK